MRVQTHEEILESPLEFSNALNPNVTNILREIVDLLLLLISDFGRKQEHVFGKNEKNR